MKHGVKLLVPIYLFAIALLPAQAKPSPLDQFTVTEPKVIGALFYADWCAACKTLDPKLKTAQTAYLNKPVLFTRFDVSTLSTQYQANLFAHTMGLEKVFKDVGIKTGFMVLIDRETGEVLGQINRGDKPDKIKDKIDKALAAAG